jgi:RNA polymerase sigma-70 factor, ECF subfamily
MAVVEPARPAGPAGLEKMYRDFAPALVDLCRRRLGDPTRAEDACHETLLRAQRAIGSFRPGAPMWPWLATIARNVCTDMHRRDARITLVADPTIDTTTPGPEETAADTVRRELLADALTSLPAEVRRSVYLRHVEGWSYEEIARADRTTLAAVRTRLSRGRRALRERVEELARHRGEWPLRALAPWAWLRARATRARLFLDRLDGGLGPALANTAPFAAALILGSGLVGSPSVPVARPAVTPSAAVTPTAAEVVLPVATAPAVAARAAPRDSAVRSAPPDPPAGGGAAVPTTTPPVHASGTLPGGTPWWFDAGEGGLYCDGPDPGPVTQAACAALASLTP